MVFELTNIDSYWRVSLSTSRGYLDTGFHDQLRTEDMRHRLIGSERVGKC
jgi:hypothetical protein